MDVLHAVFAPARVMDLAGPGAYARGVGYHRDGRVAPEAGGDTRVRATVRGTVPYTVELWVDGGEPGWSCTCPAADDGSFCKHCVAVALLFDPDGGGLIPPPDAGLVALGDAGAGPPEGADLLPPEVPAPLRLVRDDDADLLDAHVAGLDRQRLADLVLEAAASDWRLEARLLAEARAARGQGPDLDAWRRRIEAAFTPYDDFVDYREAAGWAAEVDEVVDALEELCDAGHPDAVAVLAEHAHRCADEAIQYVDDSDGHLSVLSERLSELHLRACTEGSPDPVQLARRLVDLELTAELDGFNRAAVAYAAVLGEAGLAEYHRLVEPRWQALQPATGGWSPGRYTVREAMVGVALARRDPDELIGVLEDDLTTPDCYLEIAEALAAAGRGEEAVAWARQGLDRFADRAWQTPPLRDFLAALLRERGQPSEAVELFRAAFEQAPSLSSYRRLLEEAGDDAPAARIRALEMLRARVGSPADGGRPGALAGVLVEILAYEGDVEGAWEVASEQGCDQRLWLALAHAREDTHPLDAIDVYEREVFAQIERKKNQAYQAAVDLLGRIRRLADRAGRPERFEEILARVRTEHKAKRNLRRLLDRKGW